MYAPPLKNWAPDFLTARAILSNCSSLSTAQGPAIIASSLPPMETSPTRITDGSGLKVRLASLYDSIIWTILSTPGISSKGVPASMLLLPITPMMVTWAPLDMCTPRPKHFNVSVTLAMSFSVAFGFITITILLSSVSILV